MNKTELVELVQSHLEGDTVTKKDAENALAAVLNAITDGIRSDKKVQIIGFGTFEVRERAAREGRNPKTGEKLQIAASKNIGFKASSNLKDSL